MNTLAPPSHGPRARWRLRLQTRALRSTAAFCHATGCPAFCPAPDDAAVWQVDDSTCVIATDYRFHRFRSPRIWT